MSITTLHTTPVFGAAAVIAFPAGVASHALPLRGRD